MLWGGIAAVLQLGALLRKSIKAKGPKVRKAVVGSALQKRLQTGCERCKVLNEPVRMAAGVVNRGQLAPAPHSQPSEEAREQRTVHELLDLRLPPPVGLDISRGYSWGTAHVRAVFLMTCFLEPLLKRYTYMLTN